MLTGATPSDPGLLAWAVVIVVSLVAAVRDVRTHRIANRITGPLLLGGLIFSTCVHGLSGLGWSALATVVVAAPFVILWLHGGSGAGDAKMMGAIGSWLGMSAGAEALLAVGVAGGILCLGFAIAKRHLVSTLMSTFAMIVTWLVQLVSNPVMLLVGRAGPMPSTNASATASASAPSDATNSNEMKSALATRVPYGLAIFAGVCGAAAWRYLCGH